MLVGRERIDLESWPTTAADYVIDTAKSHASINFRIKQVSGDKAAISGNLTLHGVTKSLSGTRVVPVKPWRKPPQGSEPPPMRSAAIQGGTTHRAH